MHFSLTLVSRMMEAMDSPKEIFAVFSTTQYDNSSLVQIQNSMTFQKLFNNTNAGKYVYCPKLFYVDFYQVDDPNKQLIKSVCVSEEQTVGVLHQINQFKS